MLIIIIIIVHLNMQPEGYGAAIYISKPVSYLHLPGFFAVLQGRPLLSLDFCLYSAL